MAADYLLRYINNRRAVLAACLLIAMLLAAALVVGCRPVQPPAALPAPAVRVATITPVGTVIAVPTAEAVSTSDDLFATPVGSPSGVSVLPLPTGDLPVEEGPGEAVPDPYAGLSIDELSIRAYGGGDLIAAEILDVNSYFTRTLVAYPSDGLAIFGYANTPKGRSIRPTANGRLPVIIAIHGYIDPAIYNTIDYTTRYADALARAGYLVIHPNLRGYPPSDNGENLFRVGMAVDVLNLIAIIQAQAGKPGLLSQADPDRIGLWGHSMGGGITTRVITVSPHVKAAVLYGAMGADERLNYERIFSYFSNGTRGIEELSAPEEVFARVSPLNFLDRIQAAVSIHHGEDDGEVPPAWSADLCRRLEELGKTVECFVYDDQPHTFRGEEDAVLIQRMVWFFDRKLR
jgi:dienelactone hydrolase